MQGHARWDSTPCARRGYPPLVEGAIFPIESWEGGEDIDEVVICVVEQLWHCAHDVVHHRAGGVEPYA